MAITKVTDSLVDFDSLEILTSASDTGVDLTLNGNKSSNGAVASIIFENNTDSVAMIRTSRVGGNNDAADMQFFTQANGGSNSERMRIDSSGDVLINTTTLQGVGGLSFQVGGNGVSLQNNTTTGAGNNHEYQVFRRNSTQIGSINMNGTTGVTYNTSSDYRLKENVVTDWDATTRLKQLRPSRFNFIAEPDRTVDGFLAHEVEDIVPEAITGEKDATETYTDDEGNEQTRPVYQGIDQAKLVPLLVKTIQELEARITTLENA